MEVVWVNVIEAAKRAEETGNVYRRRAWLDPRRYVTLAYADVAADDWEVVKLPPLPKPPQTGHRHPLNNNYIPGGIGWIHSVDL